VPAQRACFVRRGAATARVLLGCTHARGCVTRARAMNPDDAEAALDSVLLPHVRDD
jgi:hypothetical protein